MPTLPSELWILGQELRAGTEYDSGALDHLILGAPLGNLSLNAVMNSNGENFDYYFRLPGPDYLISGILVDALRRSNL